VISVFATPVVLLINLVNYFRAWTLPAVPPGATAPSLTDDALARLRPFTPELVNRLNTGEKLHAVADLIATRAAVTPGQVVRYVQALIAESKAAGR
jgi:hypothetical protein